MDANGRIYVPTHAKISRMNIDLAEFLSRKRRKSVNAERVEIEVDHDQTLMADLFFPNDLVYQIFVSLPAEFLYELQYFCKLWFSLINSSSFIQAHAYQSETVLIYRRSVHFGESRTFFQLSSLEDGHNSYVESNYVKSSSRSRVCIEATCDGMILVSYKDYGRRKWKLINPLTRKQRKIEIPLGTPPNYSLESFGMAYCNEAKTYKVVHLYNERRFDSSSCCEIMTLGSRTGSRSWTRITGPNKLVNYIDIPICIGGSLHWLSQEKNDCISFNVYDEKFVIRKLLPNDYARETRDWNITNNIKLVEIEGNIGYVERSDVNSLQVWVLKEDCWIKWNLIRLRDGIRNCVPIFSWRNGREMLLQTKYFAGRYAYDYEKDEFKAVRTEHKYEERDNFFIYRKTLIWYDSHSRMTYY